MNCICYELHISYHFEKLFYLKTNNVIMHHLLFIFLSHDFFIPTQKNLVGEGSEAHPFQYLCYKHTEFLSTVRVKSGDRKGRKKVH